MSDEEEYDVHAVEARLARMEAARRLRAGASKTQAPAQRQPPVMSAVGYGRGQTRQAVGDFELSEMDSSASDSEDCDAVSTSSASDDDAYRPQKERGKKNGKMRLKDSLDLSMSMSVAWSQEAERPQKPVSVKDAVKEKAKKNSASTSAIQAGTEPSDATRRMTDDREDVFAGKLIQRRRELERQATREPERATRDPRHDTQPRQLIATPEPNVVASSRVPRSEPEKMIVPTTEPKMTGTAASWLAKPTYLHKDDQPVEQQQRRNTDRVLVPPQAQAHLPVKAHDFSDAAKSVGPRPQGIPANTKTQQVAISKPEDNYVRRESSAVESARPTVSSTTGKSLMSTASASNTHPVPVPQRTKDTVMKDPIPTNPPTIPQLKKAVAFTINQTTTKAPVIEAATAKAPTETAKQGYARTGGSNQPQMTTPVSKAVVPIVVTSKNEPQEDPEDLIDDLLTAEELRLRESLDKLSSRLHSLATARDTHAKMAKASNNTQSDGRYASRKQSQLNANVDDDVSLDDTKAVRMGSYGGGAHARLHQPASPTTRVSNAKRSELSSGVHKARVRPGGTLVQDTGTIPAAEGGKHKVVIKKDLAHLLY